MGRTCPLPLTGERQRNASAARKLTLRAALVACFAAAPALAQEPSHLERLAGLCRDADGAAIGRYAGRVLWTKDGQLSGMLTREEEADPGGEEVRERLPPRTITVPKQTPEPTDGGWTLRSSALLARMGADVVIEETLIACTVQATGPVRSDPGATSRG